MPPPAVIHCTSPAPSAAVPGKSRAEINSSAHVLSRTRDVGDPAADTPPGAYSTGPIIDEENHRRFEPSVGKGPPDTKPAPSAGGGP